MHSLYTINLFIDYAQAFLDEISPDDKLQCKKYRALQTKRMLENAKLRIDRLLMANPGLTESSPDIKLAIQRYNLYNSQAMGIITTSSSLNGAELLFDALSQAEKAMWMARDGIITPKKAIESLNKVEAIKNAMETNGNRVPDTIIHRLEGVKGYIAWI